MALPAHSETAATQVRLLLAYARGRVRRPPTLAENRLGAALLLGALCLGAGLRLWLTLTPRGTLYPDEVFQSLEQAHRLAYGYGFIPWEYGLGARNWTFAGLLAGLLQLAAVFGGTAPQQYVALVQVVLSALNLGAAFATFRLAQGLGTTRLPAAVAAAIVALVGVVILLAPRALSENASLLPLVAGLALALPPARGRRARLLGASLLGLATLLRLQNGLFCAGLVMVLFAQRRPRAAAEALAVLLGWGFFYGLLDWLTWGSWFQSAVAYVRFNATGYEQFGTSPVGAYLPLWLDAVGPLVALTGLLALVGAVRALAFAALVAAYLAFLSLAPHKEVRYLLSAVPLIAALAGLGLQTLLDAAGRTGTGLAVVVAGLAALSALSLHQVTGRQMNADVRTGRAAMEVGTAELTLLQVAHDQPDLCGLLVSTQPALYTGAYAYLHQPVPLYGAGGVREARPPDFSTQTLVNYVIAERGGADGREVAAAGNLVLVRVPVQTCQPLSLAMLRVGCPREMICGADGSVAWAEADNRPRRERRPAAPNATPPAPEATPTIETVDLASLVPRQPGEPLDDYATRLKALASQDVIPSGPAGAYITRAVEAERQRDDAGTP
jgi:hypothetical protein